MPEQTPEPLLPPDSTRWRAGGGASGGGGGVVERYAYQSDGDPLAFDARWQRIVRRSAAAPTPELAAEFLFGQSAWLTMGSPTITHLDARFPALYESSATPGQWSNARDGRLLTPDPLAAAAGRKESLHDRFMANSPWWERNAGWIVPTIQIGAYFVPFYGLAIGLVVNSVGAGYERYLDGQGNVVFGGLADATGLSDLGTGLVEGDPWQAGFGALGAAASVAGVRQGMGLLRGAGVTTQAARMARPAMAWAAANPALLRGGLVAGTAVAGGYLFLGDGVAEAEGGVERIPRLLSGLRGLTRTGRAYRAERIMGVLVEDALHTPRRLLQRLRPRELRALNAHPELAPAFFGRAVERQVAMSIEKSYDLARLFEYIEKPGRAISEFRGVSSFKGMRFDITSGSTRSVCQHHQRWPRARLILYQMP